MAIKTDIRGMVWDYPDVFVVGREKIRDFAHAVKSTTPISLDDQAAHQAGYRGLVAPLTFAAIIAKLVQSDFFRHVDTGYTTMQMVQVDQRFLYHIPLVEGDRIFARMEIYSVDERFGADIVTTHNLLTKDTGELVLEAYTTMMGHEADKSVNLAWDAVSGQVIRTA